MNKISFQKGLTYTIYNKPKDYPNKVIVVGWVGSDRAGIKATCDTVEEARACIPDGLKCVPDCDSTGIIVESWADEMTGEYLLQMLQQMTPEQRKLPVMVQVPAGEYDSYFTTPVTCKILNILPPPDLIELEGGKPTICITVE
jgi:hypothetical protein